MSDAKNKLNWLWFQGTFGIASRRTYEVLSHYQSPDNLLENRQEALRDGFLSEKEKAAVRNLDYGKADKILSDTEAFGAAVLTPDSPEYPDALKNIYAKPLVLYALGDTSLMREHYLISMVGTRHPDEYGLAAAKKLSGELAAEGAVVVSGLAFGIDAACHRAALEAGGKTIAVAACGLDIDYPKRNRALKELIAKKENGLIISEYPLGTRPFPDNFPVRNRIISGISLAVIVVQSKIKSGTMHTAAHAITQDRDLYAVPHSILSEEFDGCNYLLSQGAQPAVNAKEILSRYLEIYKFPLTPPPARQISLFSQTDLPVPKKRTARKSEANAVERALPEYLSAEQTGILKALGSEECPIDEICEKLQIEPAKALSLITGLELFGLVQTLPGRRISAV